MKIQFRSMMLITTLLPETIPLPWHNLSDRRSMSLSQIPLSDTCPLYSSLCTVRAKERFSTGLGISISLSIAKSCGRPVENNNDESSLVQLSALNPHNGSSHVWEKPMKFCLPIPVFDKVTHFRLCYSVGLPKRQRDQYSSTMLEYC